MRKIFIGSQRGLAAAFIVLSSVSFISSASATGNKLSFTLPSGLPSNLTLLIIGKNGKTATREISTRKISVTLPDVSARAYVLKDGKVAFQIVSKVCNLSGKACTHADRVNTLFKRNAALGALKLKSGQALLASVTGASYATHAVKAGIAQAAAFVPLGLPSHGLATAGSLTTRSFHSRATADQTDVDADGLVNAVDSDDDGDGTLDNYDTDSPPTTNSFHVFSNLKLDLDQSLNLHTTGLDTTRIDSALSAVQSLAIQVATQSGETSELDCGVLSYCAAGGTGRTNNQDFPGELGGVFDPDSDGLGTIERGGTGDFQLQTHASSSTISAGDTLLQRITSETNAAHQVTGMLNFIFLSTPALKSIAVNNDEAAELDYLAAPILASRQNCLAVPASGDVELTLTAYRPQRPGVSGAGESEFMDLGNSLVTIDVPNAPVSSLDGPGAGPGPGNCASNAYTDLDEHLTLTNNGLQDSLGDTAASSSNTVVFKIDVTACLNNAPTPVAWNASEYLQLDLQFKSADGDNAAQKFCIRRQSAH